MGNLHFLRPCGDGLRRLLLDSLLWHLLRSLWGGLGLWLLWTASLEQFFTGALFLHFLRVGYILELNHGNILSLEGIKVVINELLMLR